MGSEKHQGIDMLDDTEKPLPKWKAEQTASPQAADHRWALVYDPTPGGKDNGDGTRSYSLRFPALILYEGLSDPEETAQELAEMLNEAEAARAARADA